MKKCLAFSLLAMIPAVLHASVVRGDAPPDLSRYSQSYQLPFSNQVNYDNLRSMNVRVSINGGPALRVQVDTGSVGMVIGAVDVPNIDPKAPAGSILYSSSGIELDGVWTPATVTFLDAKDAHGNPATAKIPVLAVDVRKTTGIGVNAGAKAPTTKLNPRPLMLGIGFGRGKEAHPEKNAFINLTEMQAGTMCRGYTITPDGISLGLTPANTAPGYIYQKLTERALAPDVVGKDAGLKDWQTTPGSCTVGNDYKSPLAAVLMDTGLTNMILCDPAGPQSGDVPDGTQITVNLLGGQLHYSFKVGDKSDPVVPRKVSWDKPRVGCTINTGLRSLARYDYLFDDTDGYLALRPIEKHP
jgi:hypothetical protein